MPYHLYKDKKKKSKKPDLITKIDLAQALQDRLTAGISHKPSAEINDLMAAVETSWDGKYYQSLDDADPRGRDMQHRYDVMEFPQKFSGKSILDIGCNLGRICIDASKLEASRSVGIDNRSDVIEAMNKFNANKGHNVELFPFDINEGLSELQKIIGPEKFDYVCVLSIWSHVDQQKLWDIIKAYCVDTCWFEDNSPSRVKSLDKIEILLKTNLNFSKIDFMGFTTDRGVRAVFRLRR